jgi:hypothetical protein
MWKKFRVMLLLVILAFVIISMLQEKADLNWKSSFFVAVYPINADGSTLTQQYIQSLQTQDFEAVATALNEQAKQYGIKLYRPINLMLGQPIIQAPPLPPHDGQWIDAILWSLKLRYYHWQNKQEFDLTPKIHLYVLYYDPKKHPILSHSTALAKGRIGRVNLFASQRQHQQNMVILAHELLHTLGASDKYDMANNLPIYPDGFANRQQQPLYPQKKAELMGGRIQLSRSKAVIPESLDQTMIGEKTAREIGWVK